MEHLQKKDVNCLMKCSGEKDSKFVLVLEYEKTTYVVLCYFSRYIRFLLIECTGQYNRPWARAFIRDAKKSTM